MNPYSLLSFFSFIVYLYLGIYTLLADKKSRVNRIFFFACLSFAIWAFSYTFLYPAENEETAWFWLRAGSIGWCSFAGFILHFSLLITKNPLVKKWWVCPLIYIPGIICLVKSLTGALLICELKKVPFWGFVISISSGWVWFFYFYYSIYVLLSIWLYKVWKDKSLLKNEKRQARIIIITTILSLIFGSLSDVILPALNVYILPPIAIVFVLIWASGMWYAIVKYKMMVLSPEISVDKIVAIMRELLILIDLDGNIIKVNPKVGELLRYSENELKGKSIETVIVEKEKMRNYLTKIKNGLSCDLSDRLRLESKIGEMILIQTEGILIKSKERDALGVIIIGEDLRKTEELEKTQKKLEIFTNFLSGNLMVSIRYIYDFCNTILKYGENLDPQIKDSLETISLRCNEVNLLVEDFIESEGL